MGLLCRVETGKVRKGKRYRKVIRKELKQLAIKQVIVGPV